MMQMQQLPQGYAYAQPMDMNAYAQQMQQMQQPGMKQLPMAAPLDQGPPPVRPGQPECRQFMKTGTCSFGPTCKFNHPLPVREGVEDCGFFVRTGNCKYGHTCKYNHPAPSNDDLVKQSEHPSRPGEEPCKFFMRTGNCTYGASCRFDHPPQSQAAEVAPAPTAPLPTIVM